GAAGAGLACDLGSDPARPAAAPRCPRTRDLGERPGDRPRRPRAAVGGPVSTPAVEHVAERCEQVLDQVERAVVGKREALELILIGLLADGHVLIEDYPGLAKTLVARSFAQVLDMEFGRIQFTPDLMPSDVTGSSVFRAD